jgi:hypothetical protein
VYRLQTYARDALRAVLQAVDMGKRLHILWCIVRMSTARETALRALWGADEFLDSAAPGWDYWGGQGQDLMYLMSSSGSASASPTELSAAP